jgi:hypothetical protein
MRATNLTSRFFLNRFVTVIHIVLGDSAVGNTVRPALGPTVSPIQRLPGAISPGVKRPKSEPDHSPPSNAEAKIGGDKPPFPRVFSWHRTTLFTIVVMYI